MEKESLKKHTDFYYKEFRHHLKLLKEDFFEGAIGGGYWKVKGELKPYPHILKPEEGIKNLYSQIRDGAPKYFELNKIAWWKQDGEKENLPIGNLLSSQIHCLNHLFSLRQDHDALLALLKPVGEAAGVSFDDVLPSFIDAEEASGNSYISFEFTYKNDQLLNERGDTRGEKCTSIDALIYARAGSERWLVPIEWKYTESYDPDRKRENHKRYVGMAGQDSRLSGWGEIFKADPLYELGRQTLLMENLIAYEAKKHEFQADNFLHLIVIPESNTEMNLDAKKFRDSVKEEFQKDVRIITPEELLRPVKTGFGEKYGEMISYLEKRYWSAANSIASKRGLKSRSSNDLRP